MKEEVRIVKKQNNFVVTEGHRGKKRTTEIFTL